MQEVSSLGIRVQAAGFILLNPNADQLAREIVPLGEPIKGLPSNVLLHHLPFKLDAVRRCCLAMAFIFRKPRTPVKSLTSTCPAPGAHSTRRSPFDPKRPSPSVLSQAAIG